MTTFDSSPTEVWTALSRSSAHLAYSFLDASTDFSIPVVVGVRQSPSNDMKTILACSASLSKADCVSKVIRDLNAQSINFRVVRDVPDQIENFTMLQHGATYMAHVDRSGTFDKMLRGKNIEFHHNGTKGEMTPSDKLRYLIKQIESLGKEAFAVDLSTRESLALGLYVVKVLVPGLQPLPYHYRCRYLGSNRLHQVASHLIGKDYQEDDVNKWPIPFA